jgi:8-oxo-dGTP pyrophosphatase MutT (NUDIX family)
MAYYNKIGLLVLNADSTKFLVCEKPPKNVTSDYIMPGGQFQEATVEECLRNEIREELNCEVDFATLERINEYTDVAAGRPDRDVSIQLYRGNLIGIPTPSTEIKFIHWIGKEDRTNPKVSPIIRNKIIQ